jgi:hypothetical protein
MLAIPDPASNTDMTMAEMTEPTALPPAAIPTFLGVIALRSTASD